MTVLSIGETSSQVRSKSERSASDDESSSVDSSSSGSRESSHESQESQHSSRSSDKSSSSTHINNSNTVVDQVFVLHMLQTVPFIKECFLACLLDSHRNHIDEMIRIAIQIEIHYFVDVGNQFKKMMHHYLKGNGANGNMIKASTNSNNRAAIMTAVQDTTTNKIQSQSPASLLSVTASVI